MKHSFLRLFGPAPVAFLGFSAALIFSTPNTRAADFFISNTGTGGNNITEYNGSGAVIATLSASGMADVAGLAFDASGNLYGLNFYTGFVTEFDSSGNYVKQFTFPGSSNHAYGLAIDLGSGTLYVAEGGASTIEKITSGGTASAFITGVTPRGLATDSSGNVWVGSNNEIEEFNSSGSAINSTFASTGSGNNITGLVIDGGGDVYAAANGNIYEYNSTGGLINTIVDASVEGLSLDSSGDLWATGGSSTKAYNSSGTLLNTFSTPQAFSNAYVAAVPEPSAAVLLVFGLAFGAVPLRRKRLSMKGA